MVPRIRRSGWGREESGEQTQQMLVRNIGPEPWKRQAWTNHCLTPVKTQKGLTCMGWSTRLQQPLVFSGTNKTLFVLEVFLLLFLRCSDTYLPLILLWTQLLSLHISVVYDLIRGNIFPLHTSVTHLLAQ